MGLVQVLLSTFNGERHLAALLDSVIGQSYHPLTILARDDGSSDGTTAILDGYAAAGHLRWFQGPHVGVRRSFLDLLTRADGHATAFAFCDQDDVWMPDKLARAQTRLDAAGKARPVLYCGRARLVDDRLQPIGYTKPARRGPSLRNALVENIAPGCTMVLNAPARALLVRHEAEAHGLHDGWAYLVVAALGRVVYDEEPAVLYRQHAGNVIGSRHPRRRWWLARLGSLWKNDRRKRFVRQAAELERLYGADLDPASRGILDRFFRGRTGALAAVRYALRGEVHRQTTLDNVVLRVLLALGRL